MISVEALILILQYEMFEMRCACVNTIAVGRLCKVSERLFYQPKYSIPVVDATMLGGPPLD